MSLLVVGRRVNEGRETTRSIVCKIKTNSKVKFDRRENQQRVEQELTVNFGTAWRTSMT